MKKKIEKIIIIKDMEGELPRIWLVLIGKINEIIDALNKENKSK
jgi:hypothetical protein